ncbi:hypothetical protein ABH922_004289 [Rhodococcus sp. 27YEA15]|uniref:hypothetical protein n=1 Tax=Rhodococcus sp. 27YEA15 TaxID=3156259 RepID=UPI003C7E12B1
MLGVSGISAGSGGLAVLRAAASGGYPSVDRRVVCTAVAGVEKSDFPVSRSGEMTATGLGVSGVVVAGMSDPVAMVQAAQRATAASPATGGSNVRPRRRFRRDSAHLLTVMLTDYAGGTTL